MARIDVELNSNRVYGGILRVIKSNGLQHGYGLSVLGKAAFDDASIHGNPLANQFHLYGDTPTGAYEILEVLNYGQNPNYNDANKFGNQGIIKLNPLSGNAVIAYANGRSGILIHGGLLGSGGVLRRTNGCLRMRNDELQYLKVLIQDLFITDQVSLVNVFETNNPNAICFDNGSCGEGDPPF